MTLFHSLCAIVVYQWLSFSCRDVEFCRTGPLCLHSQSGAFFLYNSMWGILFKVMVLLHLVLYVTVICNEPAKQKGNVNIFFKWELLWTVHSLTPCSFEGASICSVPSFLFGIVCFQQLIVLHDTFFSIWEMLMLTHIFDLPKAKCFIMKEIDRHQRTVTNAYTQRSKNLKSSFVLSCK